MPNASKKNGCYAHIEVQLGNNTPIKFFEYLVTNVGPVENPTYDEVEFIYIVTIKRADIGKSLDAKSLTDRLNNSGMVKRIIKLELC